MKHLYTILLLLSVNLVNAQISDVRQVRWWMTKQQVMATEKRKPNEQSKERLVYMNVKVGDDYANLLYTFHSNKLVSLTYTFTKLGGILYLPYISFSAIDRKITERNGEPIKAVERWVGDKEKYTGIEKYSESITSGDLVLMTTWLVPRTEIVHIMDKDIHALSYTSQLTPKPGSEESKDF